MSCLLQLQLLRGIGRGSSLLLPASAAAALAAALGPAAAVVVQLIVGRRRLPSAMAMGCSAASYPLSAALGA